MEALGKNTLLETNQQFRGYYVEKNPLVNKLNRNFILDKKNY